LVFIKQTTNRDKHWTYESEKPNESHQVYISTKQSCTQIIEIFSYIPPTALHLSLNL